MQMALFTGYYDAANLKFYSLTIEDYTGPSAAYLQQERMLEVITVKTISLAKFK